MEKPTGKALITMGVAMQLGFSIALPLILFIVLGIFADKKLGTLPLFTIAGILLAMVVSIMEIYQIIKSTQRK